MITRRDTTETSWVSTLKSLPPEGQYVLIHLNKDNWLDPSDPEGVYFKVAKLERGISKVERQKMIDGTLPNPDVKGWIVPDDKPQLVTFQRSDSYTAADEDSNNLRPYHWRTFGPGNYFGQEVDYWMPIPPVKDG